MPGPQGQESCRGILSPPTAAEPQEDLPGEPPDPSGIEGSPGEVAGMMRDVLGRGRWSIPQVGKEPGGLPCRLRVYPIPAAG